MSSWSSIAIHYTDTDRLLLECIGPVLDTVSAPLDRCFWLRRYHGGAHIQVVAHGDEPIVEAALDAIRSAAEAFISAHPSDDVDSYSETNAASMLRREGEDVDLYDLTYRNNEVRITPYIREKEVFESETAIQLVEEFYEAASPLILECIGSNRTRHEFLRLYFLHALLIGGGDYVGGSVSYLSHWEGFRLGVPKAVVQLIQENYEQNREGIFEEMKAVEVWYHNRTDDDTILAKWTELERSFARKSYASLQEGTAIVSHADEGSYKATREKLDGYDERSEFLERMYSDARFCESMRYNDMFTLARINTNLLYLALASAGLHVYDKYLLCYAAHKAVEEYTGGDLIATLGDTIESTISMNPKYDRTTASVTAAS